MVQGLSVRCYISQSGQSGPDKSGEKGRHLCQIVFRFDGIEQSIYPDIPDAQLHSRCSELKSWCSASSRSPSDYHSPVCSYAYSLIKNFADISKHCSASNTSPDSQSPSIIIWESSLRYPKYPRYHRLHSNYHNNAGLDIDGSPAFIKALPIVQPTRHALVKIKAKVRKPSFCLLCRSFQIRSNFRWLS